MHVITKSNAYLYEEDEDLVKVGEAGPHIHVEAELLLKVMAKTYLMHKATNESTSLSPLVLDTQRTAAYKREHKHTIHHTTE